MEIVADDTDIVVLLLHHWHENLKDILFSSEKSKKTWSIKDCCESLPNDVRAVLPFIHAFSGCDSTSSIFGYGKSKVLRCFRGLNTLFKF